jgi:isocitrate/isopropylmalate dehydrogenase
VSAKRVVVVEGEDAAPEAIRPSVDLVDQLGVDIEWLYPPVGQRAIEQCGSAFPPEAQEAIDGSDATLFGATSGKSAGALFYLRWGKQTYANVRPSCFRPGYRSPLAHPERVDFVIVRENLEDLYLFLEGEVEDLAPLGLVSPTARRPVAEMGPGRYALKVITEAGTERVCRFAFELARARKGSGGPGRLTSGTKHNMLPRSDGLFRSIAERVAGEYPEIEFQGLIIDDLAHQMVSSPEEFDVVVLPNLYGDVLSDAAAGLVGGLGLAPSGCYGDDYAYFESAHGTAPDIAGRNVINPTATLLSAVMLLEHLGFADAALRLDSALTRTYAEGRTLTPDQGGRASTTEFCEAVAALL